MNTDEMIDSYVLDVARLLPRKQRNDVGFELRSLLRDELRAASEAAGRAPDEPMVLELLSAFGRPADVALHYHPTPAIIDAADSRSFVRLSVIGVAFLWLFGFAFSNPQPIDSFSDVLHALGRWWTGTALPSLWWPGFMVVCFAVASDVRRRLPQAGAWRPHELDRDKVNRIGHSVVLVCFAFGLFVIANPGWMLDELFAGRAAPAAYDAFAYSAEFARARGPWLLGLILASFALQIAVIVQGRWRALTRRIEIAFAIAITFILVWSVVGGDIFDAQRTDAFAKFILGFIILFSLIDIGVKLYRGVVRIREPRGLPNA